MTGFFCCVGFRVKFKTQFMISAVGLFWSFWNTSASTVKLSMLHPSGVDFAIAMSQAFDSMATIFVKLDNFEHKLPQPSKFPCQQCYGFGSLFGMGVLCLVWIWWDELATRERFLKCKARQCDGDKPAKKISIINESFVLHSGFDMDSVFEGLWFKVIMLSCITRIFAVQWGLFNIVFERSHWLWVSEGLAEGGISSPLVT